MSASHLSATEFGRPQPAPAMMMMMTVAASLREQMAELLRAESVLKYHCRMLGMPKPRYVLVHRELWPVGKARRFYTVQVIIDGSIRIEGRGISRRMARMQAAINAVDHLKSCPNTTCTVNVTLNYQHQMDCFGTAGQIKPAEKA